MTDPPIRVNIDAIIHATESEDSVINALQKLGVNKKTAKRTITEGHFGNPIVTLAFTLTGNNAKSTLCTLSDALEWKSKLKIASEIEGCIHDSALYIRLDKQELVGGKIVRTLNGSIRVRVSKPIFGNLRAQDVYADLFAT